VIFPDRLPDKLIHGNDIGATTYDVEQEEVGGNVKVGVGEFGTFTPIDPRYRLKLRGKSSSDCSVELAETPMALAVLPGEVLGKTAGRVGHRRNSATFR
jgi:hypothetical protein